MRLHHFRLSRPNKEIVRLRFWDGKAANSLWTEALGKWRVVDQLSSESVQYDPASRLLACVSRKDGLCIEDVLFIAALLHPLSNTCLNPSGSTEQ